MGGCYSREFITILYLGYDTDRDSPELKYQHLYCDGGVTGHSLVVFHSTVASIYTYTGYYTVGRYLLLLGKK